VNELGPDRRSPCSIACRGGDRLEPLADGLARSTEEQEREGHADSGEERAGEEAGLEASVSAASGFVPGVLARTSSVREAATVETMAIPSALPIWNAVLLRPEASPDSSSATPASPATVAVTKARPMPGPKTSSPKKMSPK
jgi:hypothetical protein